MQRKTVLVSSILILIGAITTTMLFLYFPYNPYNPPHLDDTGSTPNGITEIVNANNQFALDLYLNISEIDDGNLFFSPFSIFSALAMVYEGALELTQEEIQSVFHFPTKELLQPNFAALYNQINQKHQDFTLRTGNALWCQEDFPFNNNYIDLIESYYGGKAASVDFVNEPEQTRLLINSFIEEQTNSKILDLIPKGFIDAMTRLVLTNAIFFQGNWLQKFDKSETMNQDFYITPEQKVNVPMMHMNLDESVKFNYANLDNLQILELPYEGEQLSMLICLPNEKLGTFEDNLTLENLEKYCDQMQEIDFGDISIPKFEFNTNYLMKEILINMGMPTAFGGNANFSEMTNEAELYIDQVFHQAYIKVDEEGTEAAAATAVVMKRSLSSSEFVANRPFIFYIRENESGNILFLGKVQNPSQSV